MSKGKREFCEIHLMSAQDIRDHLKEGDVLSVGWQHNHHVICVVEDGWWDYCLSGDCGLPDLFKIRFDECLPESFIDIHPVITERNHSMWTKSRMREIDKLLSTMEEVQTCPH